MEDNIFEVVRAGDLERLQSLLRANPSLANTRDARGNTPVLIAQYRDKREAVDVLLAAQPDLDIFDAAAVGRTARVAECLDANPALLHAQSSLGFSPLALAAFFGHAETVTLLLGRGADPKAPSATGASAIGLAAGKGHHHILKLLKEQA